MAHIKDFRTFWTDWYVWKLSSAHKTTSLGLSLRSAGNSNLPKPAEGHIRGERDMARLWRTLQSPCHLSDTPSESCARDPCSSRTPGGWTCTDATPAHMCEKARQKMRSHRIVPRQSRANARSTTSSTDAAPRCYPHVRRRGAGTHGLTLPH